MSCITRCSISYTVIVHGEAHQIRLYILVAFNNKKKKTPGTETKQKGIQKSWLSYRKRKKKGKKKQPSNNPPLHDRSDTEV